MRNTTKIGTIVLLFLVISGLIIGPELITEFRFYPHYPKPATRKEAWIQDLTHFRNNFYYVCKSFPKDSIPQSNQMIDSIIQHIDSLSDKQIKLLLSHCVRMANDAHTTVYFGNFRQVPLRLYQFSDGLYVIQARKEYSNLLGKRVSAIGDRSIDELITTLQYYKSGNNAWIENIAPYFLSSPDYFEAAGITSTSDSLKFTFSEENVELSVWLYPEKERTSSNEYSSSRNLSPKQVQQIDSVEWVHTLPPTQIPLYLSLPDDDYQLHHIDSLHSVYLQINLCTSIKGLASQIKSHVAQYNTNNIIVDLRFNGGGDYISMASLSRQIPEIITGHIFIITGKATFSAAICTAARLKHFSNGRVIVVGEQVGDNLQFWSEGKTFALPNSNISIRAVNGYQDFKNNRFIPFKTPWSSILYGVAVDHINPDIPIAFTFSDYRNGIDRATEEISNWILSENNCK
ncbi:peptidase S41 [Porphyromonadaceae bacterium]